MEKKRNIKKYVTLGIISAVVILLVAIPFIMSAAQKENEDKASILSDTAKISSIETTLSGAGTLQDETSVKITVPHGVEITKYLVSNGDLVAAGEPLATVDRVSVMQAVSEVQKTMNTLAKQIESARKDDARETVTAKTPGRVIKIFAKTGEEAADVMSRDGALALLSLDGKLCVSFETKSELIPGETVLLARENGEKVTGTVESNAAGKITVTLSDEDGKYEEKVTAFDEKGNEIGSGTLTAHSVWKATEVKGTVSRICVDEGKKIREGTKLFELTETEYSAEFELLTAKYQAYQDIMKELFILYQTQTIYADDEGRIEGIDEDNILKVAASPKQGEWLLLANEPSGDDQTEYVNYAGVVTAVAYETFSMKMQVGTVSVEDYKHISLSPEQMTVEKQISPMVSVPVYALNGEEWIQKNLGDIKAGDMLVLSYTEETQPPVWIIIAGHDPRYDAGGGGGNFPSWKGFTGNLNAQKKEEELFSTEKDDIMEIVPMDTVTILISIDELDILKVQTGQPATVAIDALQGQSFEGTVTKVNSTGSNAGGNSKFSVEITLKRTDKMLGGMNASAIIALNNKENILTLPAEALQDIGAETYVYTTYDENNGFGGLVKVSTGISDGTKVEITDGISEGQTVWYEYYDKLPISEQLEKARMQMQ